MGNSWRRVLCCGAHKSETSTNEPIYEKLNEHQYQEMAGTLRLVIKSVDEVRRMVFPIAEVQDSIRRLELHLDEMVGIRPDSEYMDMRSLPQRVAAEVHTPQPSIWLKWLNERVDYGEPW